MRSMLFIAIENLFKMLNFRLISRLENTDDTLKSFVTEVVKPAVKEGIGYGLVDLRDKSRAGVIDNIMRTEIRGAAFVISDLSHDNPGTYWEGGYAEGLGNRLFIFAKKKNSTMPKQNHTLTRITAQPYCGLSLGKMMTNSNEF